MSPSLRRTSIPEPSARLGGAALGCQHPNRSAKAPGPLGVSMSLESIAVIMAAVLTVVLVGLTMTYLAVRSCYTAAAVSGRP